MLAVPLVLAPAVLASAAVVERRLGSSAAGWVVSLPLVIVIAVGSVETDAGPRAAAALALGVAGHVSAQVVLALVVAAVLVRRGLLLGLVAGVMAYAACSLLVAALPIVAAVSLALVLLVAGPRLMPAVAVAVRPSSARPWWTTLLTCLSASFVVAASVLASRYAGPQLAGALAAFPAVSLTLAVAVASRDGRTGGVQALTGLVRGLPCYLAFCLVVGVAAPSTGLAALPLGLLAAVATAFVTWRGVTVLAPRAPRALLVDEA
ncbi:MAG TPA: hypothetical protein VGC37_13485 [Friedmanniella sp.]